MILHFHPLVSAVCLLFALECLPTARLSAAEKPRTPTTTTQPDGRVLSDTLPAGALVRMGSTRLRHGSGIESIAFFPDGKTVATLGHDERVCLWSTATGQLIRALPYTPSGRDPSAVAAMSQEGKTLAVAKEDSLVFVDAATGRTRSTLKPPKEGESYHDPLMLSPNGKVFLTESGYLQKNLCLWDVATGQPLHLLASEEFRENCVAFSSDSKTLAAVYEGNKVVLWDVASGKQVRQLPHHEEKVGTLAFSPDGKLLAIASSVYDEHARQWWYEIHLWDTGTWKQLRTIRTTERSFQCLAFTRDGRTLAGGGTDEVVQLWEVATGKERVRLSGHMGGVEALAFSPDGSTLACSEESGLGIRLWDVAAGKEKFGEDGHHHPITAVAVSPDSRTLASASFTICLWDLASGRKRLELPGHREGVEAIVFSPDGKVLVAAADKEIRIWDTATGKMLATLKGHSKEIHSIAFSPDGTLLASGSSDTTVRLWDMGTRKEIKLLESPGRAAVKTVAFSPDGKTLAVESGSIEYKPELQLWDVAAGAVVRTLTSVSQGLMVFSPDGKSLVYGGEIFGEWMVQGIELASGRTWRLGPTSQQDQSNVLSLAFSPDGTILAGSFPSGIRLWRMSDRKEVLRVKGHGGVSRVAFAPDGKTLISAGADTTLLVWDFAALLKNAKPIPALTPELAESNWNALASKEGAVESWAIIGLSNGGDETVQWLKQKLHPAPPVDVALIGRLIADLRSERAAVRERATAELEKLAELAEPTLRTALADKPPLSVQREIEELLKKVEQKRESSKDKRILAALVVLMAIDTPAAEELLQRLAKGAPEAWLTLEAQDTLKEQAKLRAVSQGASSSR